MNRLISGLVLPIVLLGLASCNTEPTDDLRNGAEKIVASPSQMFLDLGRSKTVEVGAVDGQGNPISAAYVATDVGSGITVVRDTTFQPVFGNDSVLVPPRQAPRFRFIVTATAFGETSFTIEGAGQSLTIPVQVVPKTDFPATFSVTTPALGETVVLTAPAGTRFTDSSLVTLPGAAVQPITVAVAPDGTTISFILPPNVNGPITVTNVVSDGAPSLVFSPTTITTVSTPVVDSVPATLSTTTPDGGQEVTLTLTDLSNFTLTEASAVAGTAITTSVAGDGSSLNFVVPPSTAAPVVIIGVVVGGFALDLPIKAPPIAATANVVDLGGDDPASAPTIEIPAAGITRGFVDGVSVGYASCGDVGFPCQVYKFVLAADGAFDVEATWEGTSDVGIYFFGSDGATLTGNFDCDSNGNGADGQPEVCTQELTAGTYFLAVVPFGPFYTPSEANPQWVRVAITGE